LPHIVTPPVKLTGQSFNAFRRARTLKPPFCLEGAPKNSQFGLFTKERISCIQVRGIVMFGEERGAILVVEDDDFMRRAIERYCASYAPTVAVSTVRDAINALDRNLIAAVLDVELPDGSGLTVLEKLREQNPILPVLVLTGNVTAEVASRAYELGAEFLSKSDDSTRLKDFLNRAIRERRGSEPRLGFSRDSGGRQTGP
jgi:CheY-like chemotaxis protein